VFFNAHPLSSDAKGKQKSLNALVPTTLAYTGGQLDFAVNMGADVRFTLRSGPESLKYNSFATCTVRHTAHDHQRRI
jgi:hypothetical protein